MPLRVLKEKRSGGKDKRSDTKDTQPQPDTKDTESIFIPGGGRSSQRGKITARHIAAFLRAEPSSAESFYDVSISSGQGTQGSPVPRGFPETFIESDNLTDENGQRVDIDWLVCEVERRVREHSASEMLHERVNGQRTNLYSPLARNTPPPGLTEGFSRLNGAIASLCEGAAGTILQSWPFDGIDRPTTENVEDLVALKAAFPQGDSVPSMILSRKNAPRPLDDAINHGLRSIISKTLHEEIFDPFHPSLSLRIGGKDGVQRSAYLKEIYELTRFEANDVDILSWRAGTFKAHEIRAGREFYATFIGDLSNTIIWGQISPFLQTIFGDRISDPPVDVKGITDIVQAAFEWNRSIKSLVPPIDLRTFVVPNNAPFDAETMEYYEKPLGSSRTKVIICAGSCGLKLHECENSEGKTSENVKILKKIKVLVPQNYNDT